MSVLVRVKRCASEGEGGGEAKLARVDDREQCRFSFLPMEMRCAIFRYLTPLDVVYFEAAGEEYRQIVATVDGELLGYTLRYYVHEQRACLYNIGSEHDLGDNTEEGRETAFRQCASLLQHTPLRFSVIVGGCTLDALIAFFSRLVDCNKPSPASRPLYITVMIKGDVHICPPLEGAVGGEWRAFVSTMTQLPIASLDLAFRSDRNADSTTLCDTLYQSWQTSTRDVLTSFHLYATAPMGVDMMDGRFPRLRTCMGVQLTPDSVFFARMETLIQTWLSGGERVQVYARLPTTGGVLPPAFQAFRSFLLPFDQEETVNDTGARSVLHLLSRNDGDCISCTLIFLTRDTCGILIV